MLSLNLDADGFARMVAVDTSSQSFSSQSFQINHIRPAATFSVEYSSYIPVDHVNGPTYVLKDMSPYALLRAEPVLKKLTEDPAQPAEVKEAVRRALKEVLGRVP
jgi:hypothetical protein